MKIKLFSISLALIALSFMFYSCDVEDNPVQEDEVSAAPASVSLYRMINSADQVAAKEISDGIFVSAVKADSSALRRSLFLRWGVNLLDQYMADPNDIYTPKGIFNVGDPCAMVMKVCVYRAGYINGLFLIYNEDDALVIADNEDSIWWDFELPDAGEWYINVTFTDGCPYVATSNYLLCGVKYKYAPWHRDWGFFNPSPYLFIVSQPG